MARWEPDAAGRLRAAAMALFVEQGFERTTVAQIAERAGVNRRTFFHHFADKGEVVFSGQSEAVGLAEAISGQPASASPLRVAVSGLQAITPQFEQRHDLAVALGTVLAASSELRARELVKRGKLVDAVADALVDREVDDGVARIAAWTAVAVFFTARDRWNRPDDRDPLAEHMERVLQDYLGSGV